MKSSARRKIGFRSLCDSAIDTTTASGELIFNIFSSLAQFERRLIQERTRAGLEPARARGRNGGRKKIEEAIEHSYDHATVKLPVQLPQGIELIRQEIEFYNALENRKQLQKVEYYVFDSSAIKIKISLKFQQEEIKFEVERKEDNYLMM